MPEESWNGEELHGYAGYDVLEAARRQSPKVDFLWLKNGEAQNLLQKIGFAILSLFWFGGGLFLSSWCAGEWRDGDVFWFLVSGCIAAFFLIFGVMGLRNVLRFKHESN